MYFDIREFAVLFYNYLMCGNIKMSFKNQVLGIQIEKETIIVYNMTL